MLFTDEERRAAKPLMRATADVLAAATLLRVRGYNPTPKWIKQQILFLEKCYLRAVDLQNFNDMVSMDCEPSCVDLGDRAEGEVILAMFPEVMPGCAA